MTLQEMREIEQREEDENVEAANDEEGEEGKVRGRGEGMKDDANEERKKTTRRGRGSSEAGLA